MQPTYNQKRFLLPDSINSCANYHIKLYNTGDYRVRIHDCNTGIRLRGSINTEIGLDEAIKKVAVLAHGLNDFKEFLSEVKRTRSIQEGITPLQDAIERLKEVVNV